MKLLIISAVLLVIWAGCCAGQMQRCHGSQWMARCGGPILSGHGGRGCRAQRVWAYDRSSRQCRPFVYRGCAGNSNRFCSRNNCVRSCTRSG